MKKIFLIILVLISILTISSVSASENATDISEISDDNAIEINTEDNLQKQDMNITIDYVNVIVRPTEAYDEFYLSFKNVPHEYNSEVSVYVDDNFIYNMDPHDLKEADFTSYGYGAHILKVTFPESSNYNPINLTHTFEITTGTIQISKEFNIGNGYVYAHFQPGATGNIVVKVDGKAFKTVKLNTEEDSTAYVSLDSLSKGTHTVEATYPGDKNNKKIYKKVIVTVKNEIDILEDISNLYTGRNKLHVSYGTMPEISLSLPKMAKKAPIAIIDGKVCNITKIDSNEYNVQIPLLLPGEYSINITYPGDSIYDKKTYISEHILKVEPHIIKNVGIYNESYIYLNLPENASGNLSVYVNGKLYETQVPRNGHANITLDKLSIGKYKIDAYYTGDDYDVEYKYYYPEFDIIKPKIIYPRFINYNEKAEIITELGENITGYLNIYHGGDYYYSRDKKIINITVPIVNGKANATIIDYPPDDDSVLYDENTIKLTYHIENESEPINMEISILVKPAVPKIITAKTVTRYVNDDIILSAKVQGYDGKYSKGQVVYWKIGFIHESTTTDKNGIATFPLDKAQIAGTNTVTLYCSKEDDYGKKTFTSNDKYTIVFQPVKVIVKINVKHIVTLKTVKVKKSAKKLVLQATVKNTKALKNKKVTFKFNGKTYKTKTNYKGIAKLTINKSVLSKLKAGKKITYQATCLGDTVKKTVKVLK